MEKINKTIKIDAWLRKYLFYTNKVMTAMDI